MHIQTQAKQQVVDITDQVAEYIKSGSGMVNVFVQHTTAAVTTADLDPGTDLDLLDALNGLLPQLNWRHPHDNSHEHVSAHLLASIVGSGVNVPFENGSLQLGAWQRIILIEFDGPRQRHVRVTTIKGESI